MSEQNKNLERWMVATSAALRALTAYFPVGDVINNSAEGKTGRLLPRLFPCQKTDEKTCQGWTFVSTKPGLGAQGTALCPCARGQSTVLLPLVELAAEFAEEFVFPTHIPPTVTSTFVQAGHRSEFLFQILSWMHWAARMGFPARQDTSWIEQFVDMPLETHQRQAMRWWVRLIELNQLTNNQAFSLVTRRGIQDLYRQGQMVAIADGFERLSVNEESLLVLCLTGDALKAPGHHSQALAWFEAFLSCVDDARAGLCLIAAQPLLEDASSEMSFSQNMNKDYRWKVRRQSPGQTQALEHVLRRGTWDRLIEALARGEHILRARGLTGH